MDVLTYDNIRLGSGVLDYVVLVQRSKRKIDIEKRLFDFGSLVLISDQDGEFPTRLGVLDGVQGIATDKSSGASSVSIFSSVSNHKKLSS